MLPRYNWCIEPIMRLRSLQLGYKYRQSLGYSYPGPLIKGLKSDSKRFSDATLESIGFRTACLTAVQQHQNAPKPMKTGRHVDVFVEILNLTLSP